MAKPASNEETIPAKRARPGGRAAAVVAAIRAATLEMLTERGYAQVEIPDIANRADVSRTTIYRRWPTKAALVTDVLLSEMRTNVPVPDTGTFVTDLERLLSDIYKVLSNPMTRNLLVALLTADQNEAGSVDAKQVFWSERFKVSSEIVTRAIARGELPKGISPRHVLELASSPLFFRVLITNEALGKKDIKEIASSVARSFLIQR